MRTYFHTFLMYVCKPTVPAQFASSLPVSVVLGLAASILNIWFPTLSFPPLFLCFFHTVCYYSSSTLNYQNYHANHQPRIEMITLLATCGNDWWLYRLKWSLFEPGHNIEGCWISQSSEVCMYIWEGKRWAPSGLLTVDDPGFSVGPSAWGMNVSPDTCHHGTGFQGHDSGGERQVDSLSASQQSQSPQSTFRGQADEALQWSKLWLIGRCFLSIHFRGNHHPVGHFMSTAIQFEGNW